MLFWEWQFYCVFECFNYLDGNLPQSLRKMSMVRYFVRHFTSGNIKKRPNYLRNILVSRTFPHDRCFLNNNQCRLRQDFFVVIILYIFLVKKLIAEGRNQLKKRAEGVISKEMLLNRSLLFWVIALRTPWPAGSLS